MADKEIQLEKNKIVAMINDAQISDKQIIEEIEERPFLIDIELMSGRNLFMEAVKTERFELVKYLKENGSDIQHKCSGSLTNGNALNLARTEKMAEYLLENGVEVLQRFEYGEDYVHPACHLANFSETSDMVEYWRKKERTLISDMEIIERMDMAIIDIITMSNSKDGLSYLLRNDELFELYMTRIKPNKTADSMKYTKRALKNIDDPDLTDRIKEMCKTKRKS